MEESSQVSSNCTFYMNITDNEFMSASSPMYLTRKSILQLSTTWDISACDGDELEQFLWTFSSNSTNTTEFPSHYYASSSGDYLKGSASILDVGLNQINVQMKTSESRELETFLFVEVLDVSLVAVIDGGSIRSVSYGDVIKLDGSTFSYDPETSRLLKSDLTFLWTCVVQTLPCNEHFSDRSAGVVYFDTSTLNITTVDITLVISKGSRSTTAIQQINIIDGYLPQMGIRYAIEYIIT